MATAAKKAIHAGNRVRYQNGTTHKKDKFDTWHIFRLEHWQYELEAWMLTVPILVLPVYE